MLPCASRISTPPICGRNLPAAVAASVMKKFGFLGACRECAARRAHADGGPRFARGHVEPEHAGAVLALHGCRCPDWSSTTTVTGLIFISRAFSSALAMIWFAFARFSVDIPLPHEKRCQVLHCCTDPSIGGRAAPASRQGSARDLPVADAGVCATNATVGTVFEGRGI